MPLRVTKEVICGDVVVRYNGNNAGGGDRAGTAVRPEGRADWITKSKKKAAKRRAAEATYRWRYLGG